jgi:hypothetical protein
MFAEGSVSGFECKVNFTSKLLADLFGLVPVIPFRIFLRAVALAWQHYLAAYAQLLKTLPEPGCRKRGFGNFNSSPTPHAGYATGANRRKILASRPDST